MRKALLLLTLAFMTSGLAQAKQHPHLSLKGASRQEQLKAIRLQISRLTHNKDAQAYAKGASGPARLTAIGQNDYVNNFGVLDSLMFTYSGTRGSSFDFDNLYYDIYNNSDLPGFTGGMGSSIQFDTMREYTTANTPALQTTGLRQYNATEKVTLFDQITTAQTTRTIFNYNSQSKVVKATFLNYDPATSQWDSSSRNFYVYSSAGYLLHDSSEVYNGAGWDPQQVLAYTNNSTGQPTFINYQLANGGVFMPFATVSITYSGTHLIRDIIQFDQGNGLENVYKDSIGYTGAVRTYNNGYNWDNNTNAWIIASQERRHLNAASLPDSVWARVDNNGMGQFDTTIQKITYNADGTPARHRTYLPGMTSLQNEERWYYNAAPNAVTGPVAAATAGVVYPNPAVSFISFKDATLATNGSWQYRILNTVGVLVAQGIVTSGAAVPVSSLPAGLYMLYVTDNAGAAKKAEFLKR